MKNEAPLAHYLALIDGQRDDRDALSYDVEPFFALDDSERLVALDKLTQLALAGDRRAIATLGRTGDARAVPVLEQLAAHPAHAAVARRALFIARCEAGDGAAIAAQLEAPDELSRTLAAAALCEALEAPLGTPGRRASLRPLIVSALDSPLRAVRHHAGRAVAAALGMKVDSLPRQHPLQVALFALSSQLPTLQVAARQRLLELYDRGQPPDYRPSADPSVPQAFWDGLRPPVPRPEGWTPYRLDLLFAMSEDDRAWVTTLVLSRLGTGDLHAADAATRLLGKAARPHLEAAIALNRHRPDAVAAAESAIAALDA